MAFNVAPQQRALLSHRVSHAFSQHRPNKEHARSVVSRSEDDEAPQIKGNWRDFRAGLISSAREFPIPQFGQSHSLTV